MICEEMARKYCNGNFAQIENYTSAILDKSETWDIHHKLETQTSEGEKRRIPLTQKELKALGVYFDRPPSELIFMRQSEHKRLHQLGGHLSEEHRKSISVKNRLNVSTRCNAGMRRKLSEIMKARNPKTFLGHHHTEESKRLLSESHKGICKGKKWYNNGTEEKMDFQCPDGFIEGRLFHARKIRNKRSVTS